MSDLLTHIGRLEMVDVDLDIEPQCELRGHVIEPEFHGGPAAYLCVSPCKRPRLVCAAFRAAVEAHGRAAGVNTVPIATPVPPSALSSFRS